MQSKVSGNPGPFKFIPLLRSLFVLLNVLKGTTMTRKEKAKEIANAQAIMHQEFLDRQVLRSCLNCDSFRQETETCTFFNARPPAKVIVLSCGDAWIGEIPF